MGAAGNLHVLPIEGCPVVAGRRRLARPAPSGRVEAAPPCDTPAPESVEGLLQRVGNEFSTLSRQLKVIARYVEQHQDVLGMQRIQDVAERCGVQPSAVVRFAKHFGYSGYHELKRLFRDSLERQAMSSPVYQSRVREHLSLEGPLPSCADITHDLIDASIQGLRHLQRDLRSSAMEDAVALLAQAGTLWIVGTRRAFPVAAYLSYVLQHADKPVQLVSQLGGMQIGQLRGMRAQDVMVAISFAPYAQETLTAVQLARSLGCRCVVITDSRLNPLATEADVLLLSTEETRLGFRGLTSTMALTQALFLSLACRLEALSAPAAVPGPSNR